MKTGLIIILIVALLLTAGGIYYSLQTQQTLPEEEINNMPVVSGGTETPNSENNEETISGNNIEIKNFAFSPSTLTINLGDTVTWTNEDSAPHTVTSNSGTELSSGTLSNGKTYSHTFNTAETFEYHCEIHNSMKAKVIVQ